jgi:uncharacterized protein YndB with AHSA1/START domain
MTASTETSSAEIVATRVFDAPRELVYRMWTDPEHVAQWWGPSGFTNTIHEMDVRPGGVWRFIMHSPDGTDYQNKAVYVEVVAPERLVYDHVSGPVFRATVTFTEKGEKTEVTMRMLFASPELRRKVAEEYGAVEGLNQTLGRLGEKLASMSMAPEDFVISRVFDAPRELVFKAWTECDRLKEWWGPKGFTMTSCKLDLRPGGVFHYALRSPGGQEMWGKFEYREVAAPERIVFINSFSDENGGLTRHPGSATWPLQVMNTLTFTESCGKTTVTLRGGPYDATADERKTFGQSHASMQQGFGGTFDQLDAYLEKEKAS